MKLTQETKIVKRLLLTVFAMAVVVLSLAFGGEKTYAADDSEIVYIPDANFKAYLNEKLGVEDLSTDITKQQMEQIKVIELDENHNISDLTGIEYCSNLKKLCLKDFDGVIDLSVIGKLKSLNSLTLKYSQWNYKISDITELGNLTNLIYLDLSRNAEIIDISVLGKLTNLSTLSLEGCKQITDISVLGNLKNLTELDLGTCTEIKDVSVLSDLTKLTTLTLANIDFRKEDYSSYISVIPSLKNLTKLKLSYCSLTDEHTAMFVNFTKLEKLYIYGGFITDYSFISKLPNLKYEINDNFLGYSVQNTEIYASKDDKYYDIENNLKDQNGNYIAPNKSESGLYEYFSENNIIRLYLNKTENPIDIYYDFKLVTQQGYVMKAQHNKRFTVTKYTKLQFTTQPQDIEAAKEDDVTLISDVVGEGEISYQWYKDGVIIDGATSKNLSLEKVKFDDTGIYKVVATDVNGSLESNEITVTVIPKEALSGELEVNGSILGDEVLKGTTVYLSVKATGGYEDYTYEYSFVHPSTGEWTTIKDFSKDAKFSYKMNSTGKRIFAVRVKDASGNIVETNQVIVQVHENITANLTINNSTESCTKTKGDTITLNISASGGIGYYTYKVSILNVETGKWSVLDDYSTSKTYSYALNYTGTREFVVTVKDSVGNTVETNKITVTVLEPLNVTVITSPTDMTVGDKLTMIVTATGGSGEYTYSYIVYNKDTKKWSRIKDNITSDTYRWTAKSAGNRVFYVDVKDSTGKVVRSSAINVKTTPNTQDLNVTVNTTLTELKVGEKLTLTATATGGSGEYTYSYIVYNKDTKKWSRIKDNITSNTYTWTAKSEGNRVFYVDVKDSTGKVVRSSAINVKTTPNTQDLNVKVNTTLTELKVGEKLTLTATAIGGSGEYTYSFIVYNKDTKKWSRIKDNITSNTYTWTAKTIGNRVFYVDVKDSTGKIVRSEKINVIVK